MVLSYSHLPTVIPIDNIYLLIQCRKKDNIKLAFCLASLQNSMPLPSESEITLMSRSIDFCSKNSLAFLMVKAEKTS